MTMTEPYPEDWEDRERLSPWWDPDDIVDLRSEDEEPRSNNGDLDRDPGPWDLAG